MSICSHTFRTCALYHTRIYICIVTRVKFNRVSMKVFVRKRRSRGKDRRHDVRFINQRTEVYFTRVSNLKGRKHKQQVLQRLKPLKEGNYRGLRVRKRCYVIRCEHKVETVCKTTTSMIDGVRELQTKVRGLYIRVGWLASR